MSQHDRSPQAVVACHQLLLWLVPQLDKFPRARRFTLGERIESGLLEVLERLIEAAYSRGPQKSAAFSPPAAGSGRRLCRRAAVSA